MEIPTLRVLNRNQNVKIIIILEDMNSQLKNSAQNYSFITADEIEVDEVSQRMKTEMDEVSQRIKSQSARRKS